jgi:hypothetical protein
MQSDAGHKNVGAIPKRVPLLRGNYRETLLASVDGTEWTAARDKTMRKETMRDKAREAESGSAASNGRSDGLAAL